MFPRRSRPKDFDTLHSGQRQERTPDGSTQTVHQNLLTRLDSRSMHQHLISRVPIQDQGGLTAPIACLRQIDSWLDRRQVAFRKIDELRLLRKFW